MFATDVKVKRTCKDHHKHDYTISGFHFFLEHLRDFCGAKHFCLRSKTILCWEAIQVWWQVFQWISPECCERRRDNWWIYSITVYRGYVILECSSTSDNWIQLWKDGEETGTVNDNFVASYDLFIVKNTFNGTTDIILEILLQVWLFSHIFCYPADMVQVIAIILHRALCNFCPILLFGGCILVFYSLTP